MGTTIKLTCRYELTQAAREALALAGTPAARYQAIKIEVDAAEALKRKLASVDDDGVIQQDSGGGAACGGPLGETYPLRRGSAFGNFDAWQSDHVLSAEEAVARYEQAWQDTCAERAAEAERQHAEEARIARAVKLLRTIPAEKWIIGQYGNEVTPNPGPDHVSVSVISLPDDVRTMVTAEQRRRDDDEKTAKAAAEAAALAERNAWIAAHGSPRLQKALAAGTKCEGIYRSERIAQELPGWEYWENGAQDEDKKNDVINPWEAHLDALLAAREQYPQGDVELWSIWDSTTDDEDRAYATVLAMDCPWEEDTTVIKRL